MMHRRLVLILVGVFFLVGTALGYRLGLSAAKATPPQAVRLQVLDAFRSADNRSLCFEFDRLVAARSEEELKPFLRSAPAAAVRFGNTGRNLCVTGFERSTAYKVELLAGLPAADGTTLAKTEVNTVTFGNDKPRINFASRGFLLPRVGAVGLPVETVNLDKLHVRVLRVPDRDVAQEMARTWWRGPVSHWQQAAMSRATTVVWDGSLAVADRRADAPVTTSLPLSDILPNRLPGAYLVTAEPWTNEEGRMYGGADEPWATQWVIDTDITLTTFKGEGDLVVFARSLDTAKTLPGVDLLLVAEDGSELARGRTDAGGRADFAAGTVRGHGRASARAILAFGPGGDFSVHDLTRPAFDLSDRGVSGRPAPGPLDAFAWTDRGIYRPGETLHVSALMRDRLVHAVDTPLRLRVLRPDRSEWLERIVAPDPAGGAHVSLELPKSARLGSWQVEIRADPSAPPIGRATFDVEDFVPQALAVQAAASASLVKPAEGLGVNLHADWLYGAPGAGLATEVMARLEIAKDPFPKWKGWRFGLYDDAFAPQEVKFPDQSTDGQGNAQVVFPLAIPPSSRPLEVHLQASVLDTGGRPNPAPPLALPVDSAPIYLGLRPDFEGGRVANGTDAIIRLVALDRAGNVVPQKDLRYELIEELWHYLWSEEDGHWHYKVTVDDRPLRKGAIDTGAEPAVLHFPTEGWTRYRLVVTSADGTASASMRFAAGWLQPAGSGDEDSPDTVSVIPDKERYAAGEVAHVTIKPPFAGETLVTIATSQPTETRELTVPAEGRTIDIPVAADWGAGTYVIVNHHRPLKGEGARGSVRAVGVAWLAVANQARTLTVALAAPDVVRPQSTLHVPLKVTGLTAGPAFVTVAAVDEGILALTRFDTPAPDTFYFGKRGLGVDIRDDYGKLIDGHAGPAGRVRQGGDSSGAKGLSVVPTRTVALFSGPVALAADGTAIVDLPIPDFSGKLRLLAVAYTADAVGHGEAATVVRYPVVADAFLPRFLAPDDNARMVVSLNNVEGRQGPFHVEVQANGPVALPGPASFDVDLPGQATHVETLPLVANGLGIATVSLHLTGPDGVDVQRSWPIQSRTPFYPISVEQTAPLASGQSFTVAPELLDAFLPGSARISVGFGYVRGIDVPTLLNALDQYPYGCTEQTTSRAMPLLAFDDPALLASAGAIPAPAELRGRVQKAIDVLVDRQGEDGRIGLWRRGDGFASSWLIAFASDFLLQARDKHYDVPDEAVRRAMAWLNGLAVGGSAGPGDWSAESIKSAQAYALYLLARSNRPNAFAMNNLARTANLPSLPMAMLGAGLAMGGNRTEADSAFQAAEHTLGAAGPVWTPYSSQLRDLAALLALSVESRPGFDPSALLDRLVREDVSASATNTQEKSWLLRAASALVHDDPVEVDVIGTQAASLAAHRSLLLTPTAEQVEAGFGVLNRGPRDIYRTLTISGTPRQPPPPLEAGFQLQKKWLTLSGEEFDPASGRVAPQDRFVVSLTGKVMDGNHRQAMLVDMLPAGFQIDRVLKPSKKEEKPEFPWLGSLSHLQFGEAKDDRLLAALGLNEPPRPFGLRISDDDDDEKGDGEVHPPAGPDFSIAYVVRAITPGRFVVPAAAIEDMYRPTVMARTTTGLVEIGEK